MNAACGYSREDARELFAAPSFASYASSARAEEGTNAIVLDGFAASCFACLLWTGRYRSRGPLSACPRPACREEDAARRPQRFAAAQDLRPMGA